MQTVHSHIYKRKDDLVMTQEQFEARMEELLKDEAFCEELKACPGPQEIADLFTQKGIEIDAEDVMALAKGLQENGEISDEDLENVSGGSLLAFLAGVVLPFAWSTLPGNNNREKLQAFTDYWYKKIRKLRGK